MKSIMHTQLRIWMACLLLAGCVTTALAQAITERMNENMITVSGVAAVATSYIHPSFLENI